MNKKRIWLIADTHWNHNNICEFDKRPSNRIGLLRKNWINKVMPCDTIIHLGDVILARKSELEDILEKLPGTKILVKGNHDNETSNWYFQRGFGLVVNKLSMSKKGKKFTITHKPDLELKDDEFNIHGHLHTNNHRDEEFEGLLTDRHILINFKNGYSPILLDDII